MGTILRRDVRAGHCFRYKVDSKAYRDGRTYAYSVTGLGVFEEDMPGGWESAAECTETFEFSDSEVELIPHWKIEEPKKKETNEIKLAFNLSQFHQDRDYGVIGNTTICGKEDIAAASAAWSSQLRKKIETKKQAEKNRVVVDWGDFWD